MKTIAAFSITLLLSPGLYAQNRSGFVTPPNVVRAPSSVVFPGGTSALPGVQRTTGSVVYPAGGNPQIGIPSPFGRAPGAFTFGQPFGGNRQMVRGGARHGGATTVYAYPVYVGGGYYENPYAGQWAYPQGAAPQQPQQPNVMVIYPPQPAPVIMNPYTGEAQNGLSQPTSMYQPALTARPVEETPAAAEPAHYLLAFKDHTIYSAVAYWVDGETLHYFTNGNTHNQVSLSLIDRELTQRLNREGGLEVKLPPVK